MALREFNTPAPEHTGDVGFTVDGEVFHCRPSVPTGLLFRFAARSSGKNMAGTVEMLDEFLQSALYPDDYERFVDRLNDDERPFPMNMLTDIVDYLSSEYAGGRERPTGQPSSGTPANPSTGDDLTDGASPAALTYSRPVSRLTGLSMSSSTGLRK